MRLKQLLIALVGAVGLISSAHAYWPTDFGAYGHIDFTKQIIENAFPTPPFGEVTGPNNDGYYTVKLTDDSGPIVLPDNIGKIRINLNRHTIYGTDGVFGHPDGVPAITVTNANATVENMIALSLVDSGSGPHLSIPMVKGGDGLSGINAGNGASGILFEDDAKGSIARLEVYVAGGDGGDNTQPGHQSGLPGGNGGAGVVGDIADLYYGTQIAGGNGGSSLTGAGGNGGTGVVGDITEHRGGKITGGDGGDGGTNGTGVGGIGGDGGVGVDGNVPFMDTFDPIIGGNGGKGGDGDAGSGNGGDGGNGGAGSTGYVDLWNQYCYAIGGDGGDGGDGFMGGRGGKGAEAVPEEKYNPGMYGDAFVGQDGQDGRSFRGDAIRDAFPQPPFDEPEGPDADGYYTVKLTEDSGPIVLPDNLGKVKIDLNGHSITGTDGTAQSPDGVPAITVTNANATADNAIDLVLEGGTVANAAEVKGGDGANGNPPGDGAPGILFEEDAQGKVSSVRDDVDVIGGKGGNSTGAAPGGNGGAGIVGDVEENWGTIAGGDGGEGCSPASGDGTAGGEGGNGGAGVEGDVADNDGDIFGGNGGNGGTDADGNGMAGGNGGVGVDGEVANNDGMIAGGNGGDGGDGSIGGNGGQGGDAVAEFPASGDIPGDGQEIDGLSGNDGESELPLPPEGFADIIPAPDGEVAFTNGVWTIVLQNDVDGPVRIPDNMGEIAIDLNGCNIYGQDGSSAHPDGGNAIEIYDAGEEGEPTHLALVDNNYDPENANAVWGGNGRDGTKAKPVPGKGGTGVLVELGADEGVLVDVGENVVVIGGNGGAGYGDNAGADGGAGVVGNIGENEGTIAGGNGGDSADGDAGNGGAGVDGDVEHNAETGTITGGNGGLADSDEDGLGGEGGNGGAGVEGDVADNDGDIFGGNGGNGGTDADGNGMAGGNGGSGVDGEVANNDGTIAGGDGGNGGNGSEPDGNGGNGGNGGDAVTDFPASGDIPGDGQEIGGLPGNGGQGGANGDAGDDGEYGMPPPPPPEGLEDIIPSPDGEVAFTNGIWTVILQNDVDGPVRIPDNMGEIAIDLNGCNIYGQDGTPDNPDGGNAIEIYDAGEEGEPTRLALVDNGYDPENGNAVWGGNGRDGTKAKPVPGKGGAGVLVEPGADEGVLVDVGENVSVIGGKGGAGYGENAGADGGAGIDGNVGENEGDIFGGDGGDSADGNAGNGGAGVDGDVEHNAETGTITGGNGGDSETGTGGNGGEGVSGDVGENEGTITGGNGGDSGEGDGGNGGAGVEGDVEHNGETGTITGGDGGDSDEGNGGNGGEGVGGNVDTNEGTITGGNGGDSDEGNGGNGGEGVGGETGDNTGDIDDGDDGTDAKKEAIEDAFPKPPFGEVEGPDEDGYYTVKLTEDSGPIVLPDNLGKVKIDLNGHAITGTDGTAANPDGIPAITVTNANATAVNAIDLVLETGVPASQKHPAVKGGDGADGNPPGAGAPGVKFADDAQGQLSVGNGVDVVGGKGGNSTGDAPGGEGGAGVEGDVGDNEGTITGGDGGDSADGDGGNGGAGVDGDVEHNGETGDITGGNGGDSETGNGGNGGEGVSGDVGDNEGTITGGDGGDSGEGEGGEGGEGVGGETGDNTGDIDDGEDGGTTVATQLLITAIRDVTADTVMLVVQPKTVGDTPKFKVKTSTTLATPCATWDEATVKSWTKLGDGTFNVVVEKPLSGGAPAKAAFFTAFE